MRSICRLASVAFLAAVLVSPGVSFAQSLVFDGPSVEEEHQALVMSYQRAVGAQESKDYPLYFSDYFEKYVRYGKVDLTEVATACEYWQSTKRARVLAARMRAAFAVAFSQADPSQAGLVMSQAAANAKLTEMQVQNICLEVRFALLNAGN